MEKKSTWEKLPFWKQLKKSEQDLILGNYKSESIPKGNMINRSEDSCQGAIIVESGELRVFIVSEEGREITLYRLQEGDVCVLSASCLLDAIVFDVMIEAKEKTEIKRIPSPILHELITNNVYVELFLSKTANERFSDVMWMMQQILFMSADKRVAIFLWDQMTEKNTNVIVCTHEEIAHDIGSAREVVSRILKYFSAEGIVQLGRGKVQIMDREKLKTFM